MIYLCLRFLRCFEKWSELGKMGKNGVKWLSQKPHIYTTDDIINVSQNLNFLLVRVENILGKGENAGYQHFLFSPKCFQTAFFKGLLTVGNEC